MVEIKIQNEDILFKYRLRKPKEESKINYGDLELSVSLFEPKKLTWLVKKLEKKKEKRDVIEEGSFLLNERGRIMAAGSFYVREEESKKFLVVNGLNPTSPDYRKKVIEVLKKYSEEKGYKALLF